MTKHLAPFLLAVCCLLPPGMPVPIHAPPAVSAGHYLTNPAQNDALLAWPALSSNEPVKADEKKAEPTPPPIILPDAPPAPPVPIPPKTPTKLASDQIYVIRAAIECRVVAGTEGLVKITSETGPLRIRGRFTDGIGVETRTLTEKYLYIVEAAGTGKTDLIIIPTTGEVLRRCLDVDNGTPVPPTPPTPPTPADPLTVTLQAAYALDTDTDKAKSLAFLQAAYKGMAANVKPGLATNADALAWLKAVIEAPGAGLTATQIVSTRKAVGAELLRALGASPTTALDQTKFAAELGTISNALAGVR